MFAAAKVESFQNLRNPTQKVFLIPKVCDSSNSQLDFSNFPVGEKLSDIYFPILKILRMEKKYAEDNVYSIDSTNQQILLQGNQNEVTISQERFDEMAKLLLQKIKNSRAKGGKEKLEFPDIETFMNELDMHELKAKSTEKKDIRMVIHDMRTDRTPEMGFSIKSKNAMSDTKEKRRQGFFQKWFEQIEEWGYKVEYAGMMNDVFFRNLRYIDTNFHKILAECLLVYYSHKTDSKLSNVLKFVANIDPCELHDDYHGDKWYEYCMKQFLIIYALGMTANKPWDCKYVANGGYIVVKEDGDIVCYHFYDRNQLENYLFNNTAFDTPSTSRHDFYQVWCDDNGETFLKLNPQIRFIHDK
ncbi:MAG: HpaII family restriction endonuclease [Prevotella sp.]|nr:HpaII family restriction endonuclease [Prevotella sp.]